MQLWPVATSRWLCTLQVTVVLYYRKLLITLTGTNLSSPGEDRVHFIVTSDTRLPAIPAILTQTWQTMVGRDPQLLPIFPKPPQACYKWGQNLANHIIWSTITLPTRWSCQRSIPLLCNCTFCCSSCFMESTFSMKKTQQWKGKLRLHKVGSWSLKLQYQALELPAWMVEALVWIPELQDL